MNEFYKNSSLLISKKGLLYFLKIIIGGSL